MIEVMLARVSNRADWSDVIELTDADTGDAIDLSEAVIVVEVADDSGRRVLSATTGNGKVVVLAPGKAQFSFTRAEMSGLCPGTYRVGGTVTISGVTEQVFFGTVPLVDGVVAR
jgi:hypothetical protein